MQREPTFRDCRFLGIEQVVLVESLPVARVDLMTRSPAHARELESRFQTRPFRFRHGEVLLHAFPRLPAASAREWLEEQGLAFVLRTDGLAPGGPDTWIQSGHTS
jgi:hypothetical protein